MPIDSITIRLTDGIKGAVDYAPNKLYDLTAIVSNPTDAEVEKAVALIVLTGERFLGRAAAPKPASRTAPKIEQEPAKPEPEPEPEPVKSDVSDLLPDIAPAREVSNDDIIHAVMKKNEALKDATKIRALVETYNPNPGLRVFKATEIPAAQRAEFLEKLGAL